MWLEVDDFTFLFWMVLITLGQLAGFIAGMVQYSRPNTAAFAYDGWTYPIAKGSGRALQVWSSPGSSSFLVSLWALDLARQL